MKILFVTDAVTIGGSEIYLREMLPRLQAKGLTVASALPLADSNLAIRQQLQEQGIWVHAYKHVSEIPRTYDIALISNWYPQSFTQLLGLAKQSFAMVHDQLIVYHPWKAAYIAGVRMVQIPNFKHVERVLTVSDWGADFLRRVYNVQSVRSVCNGVDTEKFSPASPAQREALRQKYGFNRFTVLMPARISLEKNHLAMLQTAHLTPDIDYIIVGKGELENIYQRVSPPNVKWWGKRWDMPDLYRAADAMFQPTLGENQSLATLEAMSSGLAIVTSQIPAQKELITHEKEGLTVPHQGKHLAHALRKLQAHPAWAQELGLAARAKVLSKHTLDAAAERLIRAITD